MGIHGDRTAVPKDEHSSEQVEVVIQCRGKAIGKGILYHTAITEREAEEGASRMWGMHAKRAGC